MDLLNRPISSFEFGEVEAFCRQGFIEGTQLDYKRELPSKGLSKHFAAFSNTRGGVIVIGVEEDSTGKPIKWEGLTYDSKIVDQIHQYATNVDPRPSYDVHITKEMNEKVFILVRIFEGDLTPYYVQNDSNIYVRTGNITDPIDTAKPDAVEILFKKKEKADLARENYLKRTKEIFKAALKRAEQERLNLIAIERDRWDKKNIVDQAQSPFKSQYVQQGLGSDVTMLTLILQPHFPKNALTTPQSIRSKLDEIRVDTSYDGRFPDYNLEPIQDGLLKFDWGADDGSLDCQQIYSTGLLYDSLDILRQNQKSGKYIWMNSIASNIMIFLKAAALFYKSFNFQGGLRGNIFLEKVQGVKFFQIIPEGFHPGPFYFEEAKTGLLDSYNWDLEIDTTLLGNLHNVQTYYIELIQRICWSLGYGDVSEELIKNFLKGKKWLAE